MVRALWGHGEFGMTASVWPILACWCFGAADAPAHFPESIRNTALQSTIRIVAPKAGKLGSGVAVAQRDGYCYALTAQHVVAKAVRLDVVAQVDGEAKTFTDVEVVAGLPESDLALIRFPVKSATITYLRLAEKSRLAKKDFPIPVLNSGWQGNDGPTCAEDQALARVFLRHPERRIAYFCWQTKEPSEEGRSGGPLINAKGELIGICSGNLEGKSYFTHLDEIHYFIRKHSSCPWLLPAVE
jgi:S1-C subfamily serine protease